MGKRFMFDGDVYELTEKAERDFPRTDYVQKACEEIARRVAREYFEKLRVFYKNNNEEDFDGLDMMCNFLGMLVNSDEDTTHNAMDYILMNIQIAELEYSEQLYLIASSDCAICEFLTEFYLCLKGGQTE